MLASPKNRIRFDVDNPIDSDGFYRYWRPRGTASHSSTVKLRRRALRSRERRTWQREVREGRS